jgi:hypothetical protein
MRQEAENCMQQACVTIPAISSLDCVIEITHPVGCEGEATGELGATVTGGQGNYIYQWGSMTTDCSDGSVTDVSTETGSSITNLSPGKYSLTVTDATGCSSNRKVCEIEICPSELLGLELESTQPDCVGGAINGIITAFPSGGTGQYSYTWTGPNGFSSSNPTIDNLSPGLYSLLLSDINGCNLTLDTELIDPGCVPEEPEEEEELGCDCDNAADGEQLFEVTVSTTRRKRNRRSRRGRRGGSCNVIVKTATHKVRFLGSSYDETNNTTSFSYRVTNCGSPDISHFAFGSIGRYYKSCFGPDDVVATTGGCTGWKRRDNSGISGLKFEHSLGGDCTSENSVDVSFSIRGNVGTTTTGFYVGIKAGNGNNQVEIPGPDCHNIQCPADGGLDRRVTMDEASDQIMNGEATEKAGTEKTALLDGSTIVTPTEEILNSAAESNPIIEVFPNPFVEYVNIVLDQPAGKSSILEVVNVTGKVVHKRKVNEGYSTQRIDLTKEPKGIYLIRIKGDEVTPQIFKVMKH